MNKLRVFVKLDSNGNVTSQIVHAKKQPRVGKWIEISSNVCCTTTTTIDER